MRPDIVIHQAAMVGGIGANRERPGKLSYENLMLGAHRKEVGRRRGNEKDPVNVGFAFEISIRQLVELIAELTGFRGRIRWDANQPNGQPRRRLDTSRAEREFGLPAEVQFRDGLRRTVEWYEVRRQGAFAPYIC